MLREVEVAISLSHLKVYEQHIVDKQILSFICEDDIILPPNVFDIITHLFTPDIVKELLSEKPIIIFCGGARNNPGLKITDPILFQLKEVSSGVYSNYCYILNRAAAILLKSYVYPIKRPDDSYKRYLINKKKLKSYQIIPSIVAELSSGINSQPVYSRLSKQTSINELKDSMKREEDNKNNRDIDKDKEKGKGKAKDIGKKGSQIKVKLELESK